MKKIALRGKKGKDKFILVSDKDYLFILKYKWHLSYYGYAACRESEFSPMIYMHRLIMEAPTGMDVDHKNGNTLDNRRSNLRICTRQENLRNRHKIRGFSKFKGVRWHKQNRNWRAGIKVDSKDIHIGCFKSEILAAKAYNKAAKKYFGEYARLNILKS